MSKTMLGVHAEKQERKEHYFYFPATAEGRQYLDFPWHLMGYFKIMKAETSSLKGFSKDLYTMSLPTPPSD